MKRRDFLSSALAAPLAPSAAGRVRIAFLGATHPHASAKVQVVRDNTAFELAGICEDDPAAAARYEKAGIPLLPREGLLGDDTIQVVAVESAVKDHAAGARAALEAGKHVHLEKPPSTDLKSFRDVLALAARKGLLLQVGYMWRHHPGINAALEAGRKGWLGDVFMVRGTINTLLPAAERTDLAFFRGGQMFELGCHLIDPMVRLLGRPLNVTPVLKKTGTFDDALADNTVAVFEFARAVGIVASASIQQGAFRHRSFEVFGANGNAVVRPLEPPVLQIDLAKAAGPYQARMQTVELPKYARYVDDFAELAAAVKERRALTVTPEEDLAVHEALLQASAML